MDELGQFSIRLGKVKLNKCEDLRPCVIIEQNNEKVYIMLISSATSIKPPTYFLIKENSDDFATTGLKRTSYVLDEFLEVHSSQVDKYIGKLDGDLLEKFKDWIGFLDE